LLASSDSIASSSGTLADTDLVHSPITHSTNPTDPSIEGDAAASFVLADNDSDLTWADWIEIEKAKKAERQKAEKAARLSAGNNKHTIRWALLQRRRQAANPFALACAG